MTKSTITYLLAAAVFCSACGSSQSDNRQDAESSELDTTLNSKVDASTATQSAGSKFDINSLPLSTADLGDFPFFTAPEGAEYINRVKPLAFDFIVFVTETDIYEVEGKTFRAYVHPLRDGENEVRARYLLRSYEDAITKAGGVKVFEGKLSDERLEQYKELCTYAGSDGSIDVWNDPIMTYAIRHTEGNIYIALQKGDYRTTAIQIVQEAPFVQTIEKVTASEISKDLTEKGKSILYINFDVDKATITPEGQEVVNEIAAALKENESLRIGIEGHTDNSGSAAHNKTLSDERANAVMAALTSSGIDKQRLTAKGFGAERPLVANDSEENMAKNRRVELVKLD